MTELAAFITSEQRERTALFDSYTENVDEVLRAEPIVRELGELTCELLSLNERAYLPDVRNGTPTIPKSKADSLDPAIFPLVESFETSGSFKIPLEWYLPIKLRETSIDYMRLDYPEMPEDECVEAVLQELEAEYNDESELTSIDSFNNRDALATTMGWSWYLDDQCEKAAQSPQLVVLLPILNKLHPYFRAGTLAHEYAHIYRTLALPKVEDEDAYSSECISDELFANRVNACIDSYYFNRYDTDAAEIAKLGITIELGRRVFSKAQADPFTPNDQIMSLLAKYLPEMILAETYQ